MLGNWFNEDQFDRLDREEPSEFDLIDWEKMRASINPIEGQTSMFPPEKNFLFRSREDNNNLNNISQFNDIIYKNPSYTAWELLELHEAAQVMYTMKEEDA